MFIYESTGSYSTILEHYAQEKKIKYFKVGAYQSSSFSKVIKNRNKTDIVDARMLSQMHILATDEDIKIPFRDVKAHQIRSYIKYGSLPCSKLGSVYTNLTNKQETSKITAV